MPKPGKLRFKERTVIRAMLDLEADSDEWTKGDLLRRVNSVYQPRPPLSQDQLDSIFNLVSGLMVVSRTDEDGTVFHTIRPVKRGSK